MFGSLLVVWLAFSRRRHVSFWVVSMVVAGLASPMLACFVAGHLAAVADVAGLRRNMLPGMLGGVAKLAIFAFGVYIARDEGNDVHLAVAAVLIFLACTQSAAVRGLLSTGPVLALGRRSVTIYLTHWAFIFGFGSWVLVSLDQVVPWQTARLFVAPAVAFVVLAASGPLSQVDRIAVLLSRRAAKGEVPLSEVREKVGGVVDALLRVGIARVWRRAGEGVSGPDLS
jgi:peptidoglycan/LPS O-acetylase OafA/YrhL